MPEDQREERAMVWVAIAVGVPLIVLCLFFTGLTPFGGLYGHSSQSEALSSWFDQLPERMVEANPLSQLFEEAGGERFGPPERAGNGRAEEAGAEEEGIDLESRIVVERPPDRVAGGTSVSPTFSRGTIAGLASPLARPATAAPEPPAVGETGWSLFGGGLRSELEACRERNRQLEGRIRELELGLGASSDAAETDRLLEELAAAKVLAQSLQSRVAGLERSLETAKQLNMDLSEESARRAEALEGEILTLRRQLSQRMGERDALQRELDRVKAEQAAGRKENDAMDGASVSLMQKLEEDLARERAGNEALLETVKGLQGELASLKAAMTADETRRLAGQEAVLRSLRDDLTAERGANLELKAELEALRKGMDEGMVPKPGDPEEVTSLRLAVRQLDEMNRKLTTELESLQGELKRKPAETGTQTMAALAKSLEDAQVRIRELEAQLRSTSSKGGSAGLEMSRPGDLSGGAAALFEALRAAAANGLTVAERDALIRTRNLGRLVGMVYFGHDESEMGVQDQERLLTSLGTVPAGTQILVVGYASVRGTASYNLRLSSRRATRVAGFLATKLPSTARMQTIYFGETDQFDARDPGKNRVVEVWRIDR